MSLFGLELELTRPWHLLGLVALPLLVLFHRRSLVDFARWQRRLSLLVRSALVLLLVLALAGLVLLRPTDQKFVIFAVDRSVSIGDAAARAADAWVKEALAHRGGHRAAFLDFAGGPGPVVGDRGAERVVPDTLATDLAAALEVAAASLPPFHVPKIVLLTDGNETRGDALRTALALGDVPVSTVPLPARDDPEVQVSDVTVPAEVRQGEPFHLEVVVDSSHGGEGFIDVYRGAHRIVSERTRLAEGPNRFRFRSTVRSDRLVKFAVHARGFQDTLLDNNRATGLVFAAGKPRVLVVESDTKSARHLRWALAEEDIVVDVRPPEGSPSSLADLQNYELLVLSDVPATALSLRQMELLRTWVQDLGGGLVMVGGERSFGLGGYYKTVLEDILPVRSDFEKEKEKPSLAMVLILDKSGSMGGTKIELAKEAAKGAVELLGPRDRVAVIAFDGAPHWVCELGPASNEQALTSRISTIKSGGGTALYQPMEWAYRTLDAAVAKLKHVIILTDGRSSPGDFEGITRTMASARMTVSTVGLGKGANQSLLKEIAEIGGGRNYFTDDPGSVPQIFAKETVVASRSAIKEEPFLARVVRPSAALEGIDFEAAPFLLGYVATRPKPTSEVILATESGDPLLAWWRYGLGFTVAFTSDAKSRWAAEWVAWPGFSRFWAQVVRHAMRKGDAKGFLVGVERRGRRARVVVDSVDPTGRFVNGADTTLTLIDPDLDKRDVAMEQVAPGRYEAELDLPDRGSYHLELQQAKGGRVLNRQSRGLVVGYPDELRLGPADERLLQGIAAATGGRWDPDPADVFGGEQERVPRAVRLWPHLLVAALLLLVLDVALRRLDLERGPGRRRTP